jgi:hypothetical protein
MWQLPKAVGEWPPSMTKTRGSLGLMGAICFPSCAPVSQVFCLIVCTVFVCLLRYFSLHAEEYYAIEA